MSSVLCRWHECCTGMGEAQPNGQTDRQKQERPDAQLRRRNKQLQTTVLPES